MALVAFSPSRSSQQEDLHPYERLALHLSSCFSTIEPDDVEKCVAEALAGIGTTFGVDECTLVAYCERGVVKVVHSWAAAPHPPTTDDDLASMPWLVQRLARNAVVATTPASDLPAAAAADTEHAARTGVAARLAVPVAMGGRVVNGLIVGSRQRHVEWRVPVIERLTLMGEILGSGLERVRQQDALRASHGESGRFGDAAQAETVYLREEARNQVEAEQVVGESAALRTAVARMGQVAPLDATVLLLGETGTGKELFAHALHDRSRRRERMLVKVNCAALPASLIESELFGHERGAFTGAIALDLQAKLLRVLQEGEFERVGSSKARRVDVRVIAATHVDLDAAVAEGRFRADLFYRLSVFPITLPPLRDRPDDIPQLVWFFIHKHQRELGRRITSVPAAVTKALQHHDWPGNVRELENVVERAMIRTTGSTLELDETLRATARSGVGSECGETLDAVQRCHIERVLRDCGWRINGIGNAAVRLGLHPNTLRFRMRKLGLVIPDRRGSAAPTASAARIG
jgi:transcriptional regulator with GAF, ATPase, and Fis domain